MLRRKSVQVTIAVIAAVAWIAAVLTAWGQTIRQGDRVGIINSPAADRQMRNNSCAPAGTARIGEEGVASSRFPCSGMSGWYLTCRTNAWLRESVLRPLPGTNCIPNVRTEYPPGDRYAYEVVVFQDAGSLRVRSEPSTSDDRNILTSRPTGAVAYTRKNGGMGGHGGTASGISTTLWVGLPTVHLIMVFTSSRRESCRCTPCVFLQWIRKIARYLYL